MAQTIAFTYRPGVEEPVTNGADRPLEARSTGAHPCGIVGRSSALRAALRDARLVASTDTTVLVTGESGTGKELVACAIHDASRRRERAMIKVNCAAVPANLIESEFFGHERGAFTGATARRDGRFALADGGTIFLDEIAELPLELQVKLLRVLQEGEFEPVGASRTRTVDVRVIAATNRDLALEVAAGRFRKDLYYRLNVFHLHLPALRDRVEDIPLLVQAFVERLQRRMGRNFSQPSREWMQRLQTHSWPGNLRELLNVVERAAVTAQDGHLDFDRALPHQTGTEPTATTPGAAAVDRVLTIQELDDLERANLQRALTLANGRVSGRGGAAELLGINPSTLASRLKALGLHRRHAPAAQSLAATSEVLWKLADGALDKPRVHG